jgi:adenosylcobinamide amidohydrolase
VTARVPPTASRKPARVDDPWRWSIAGRTLVVTLPELWLVLGWAPLGGGFKRADLIVNHQIEMGDFAATGAPRKHLMDVVEALRRGAAAANGNGAYRSGAPGNTGAAAGVSAAVGISGAGGIGGAVGSIGGAVGNGGAVGMMTGAQVARLGHASLRRDGLAVGAWCTAGCSNALRVGDRSTAGVARAGDAQCPQARRIRPGTINIIVTINQPLTRSAMAEALQIAVEARVAAVHDAGIKSIQSGGIATGTGTDCIVVAAPVADRSDRVNSIVYCGKHTLPGELIGRVVMRSCATAIARANPIDRAPPLLPD